MISKTKMSVARAARESELFQILRDGQPRTKSELANLTGLSRSTITLRVQALSSLGLIKALDDEISTGGRPTPLLTLNPDAKLVVAADIGASHASVAIVDLFGKILLKHSDNFGVRSGPESVLTWLVDASEKLLSDLGRNNSDLISVGIGLPGPVEYDTGRLSNPGNMPGWDHFDVRGFIQRSWDVPVLVDNDVNIMALGERNFAWPDVDDIIFIKVSTGIGAAVISNGNLIRGALGFAGDIGHVQIARGTGIPCHCGNVGCLEALASGPAIVEFLRGVGIKVESVKDVVELVSQGNFEAIQAVRTAGRDIAEVLTPCVSLVNPSVIVIGGALAPAVEHLIAGIREVLYSRSMPLATEHLSIVQSKAAQDAGIIGASILAIEYVLSPGMMELTS